MDTRVFKRNAVSSLRGEIGAALFTLAVIALVVAGLARAEAYGRAEGRLLLEESLQNAVVQCYVVEGRYPPGLEYIKENYGVAVDGSGYAVHYEVFAPNMPPDITVLELERGRRNEA